MTSPAVFVLSLALVCSIIGTASETADHGTKSTMTNMEPEIYDEIESVDLKIKIRTKVDDYRILKDYLNNVNYNEELILNNNNNNDNDNDVVELDDIDKENRKFRYTNNVGEDKPERQYNVNNFDSKDSNNRRRVKRDVDPESRCAAFNFVKNKVKITHPNNKNSKEKHYYNHIDCVTVIKANEGQVIKLTFVDVFHIEEHPNCKYDYLEIRDGQQGYSELLGKMCGSTFPSQITSSGPYLWLKFHSDETIEYEGFHININFEVSPISYSVPETCTKQLKGWYGVIDSSKIDPDCNARSASHALDALWAITSPPNTKIFLNFTSYKLVSPNDCEENLIQVFGYVLEYDASLAHYCGSIANSVTTKGVEGKTGKEENGNIMYVRMYASKTARGSLFEATFTAFRTLDPNDDSDRCSADQFDCQDNTCIAQELKCNSYANCRLKADEDQELCKNETESIIGEPHILVILVIFSLILSGMSFVFLFKCIKKLYQDHKIIEKRIFDSCEDRLDTLMGDGRFPLDAKKLQRESEPRAASLERENHTNEMYKQQRNFSHHKPSSIDSDFIQETRLDLDEEIWRRDVDSVPVPAQDIKVERNGRMRRSDTSKREESMRSKKKESEEPKEKKEIRDASVGAPDTKESGCQTRESLFQPETAPSSNGSGSNSRGFSTFGYSGATIARPPTPSATTNTSQITIELLRQVTPPQESVKPQKKIPDRRPMSAETTRSAPDVIIVSKPIR